MKIARGSLVLVLLEGAPREDADLKFFQASFGKGKLSVNGLLLLASPEGVKTAASDLDDLESDSRNISLGVSLSSESSNEDLVVLVNVTHASVSGDVGGDSLVVLFKLNSYALSDGRVRLLGLNGNLLDHDSRGHGSLSEGLLPLGA